MRAFDLAIVGGGPAGQAAAVAAGEAGLSVVVLDEQARPGGQILRQPPVEFRVANWLPGSVYRSVKAQLGRFEALQSLTWLGRRAVVGIVRRDADFEIIAHGVEGIERIAARSVLVAGGCYDLPMPMPGWTLPGVMSAGGVQSFIKSQLFIPGDRFLFAGTHPLQLVVASQIVEKGGAVEAVLFAQPRGHFMAYLARHSLAALRGMRALAAGAAALARLRAAGVPVRFGAPVIRIEGDQCVRGVRWAGGSPGAAECDRVALGYGFIPQSDLVRALGSEVRWIESTGGWRALHDEWMRTSVGGLYVAGETTGVAGADVALAEGRIAGIGIALDQGALTRGQARRAARSARRALVSGYGFAALLDDMASPRAFAPVADADTILCRCEAVTNGMICSALAANPAPASINTLKLVTRAGMGPCQGRGCEPAILRAMARTQNVAEASLAGYTPRFPVRPVAVGDLASEGCD